MSELSIIIPVYNCEKYLEQCLNSIINQTFFDIEIICVNDGSTDNSLKILEEFKKKDNRIIIINKESNTNAGECRNIGFKIAKGHYVQFLDSDDFYEPTMFEKLHKIMYENDLDIGICNFDSYEEKSNSFSYYEHIKPIQGIFEPLLLNYNVFDFCHGPVWYKMYNKKFLEKNEINFQSIKGCNDLLFDFVSKVQAKRVMIINEILLHYRRHQESLSGKRETTAHCIFLVLNKLKEVLKNKNLFEKTKKDFISIGEKYIKYLMQYYSSSLKLFLDYTKYLDFENKIYFSSIFLPLKKLKQTILLTFDYNILN